MYLEKITKPCGSGSVMAVLESLTSESSRRGRTVVDLGAWSSTLKYKASLSRLLSLRLCFDSEFAYRHAMNLGFFIYPFQ